MPFGVPKSAGGDTPENDAKMEDCISRVMSDNPGLEKVSAIRICKRNLFGRRRGKG